MNHASKAFCILMLLVAAACSQPASSRGPNTPSPSPPPTTSDQLVLKVETGGGFVPAELLLAEVPTFALYADGRLITQGPQILIFPGPALPNLIERRVSPEGVAAISEAARRAGLASGNKHLPLETVADAPTTTFTFVENGTRHVVTAYALGMEDEDMNVPPADREARKALAGLRERLSGLESWLPPGSLGEEFPYDFKELRMFVRAGAPSPGPGLEQPPAEWPLPRPLSDFGAPTGRLELRCGAVTGEDLRILSERVRRATELTPWVSAGTTYSVVFRPLLPDESGCP
ncbi:MAG: hypothetical protein M3164_05465 [Actinomycetota bacterium]|nr:hypothetical protein [Actinomycetota bacterium]